MKHAFAASAALLCLAACESGEETIAENLSATPEAGGAAEAGRPVDENAAITTPPAEGPANAATNTATR